MNILETIIEKKKQEEASDQNTTQASPSDL